MRILIGIDDTDTPSSIGTGRLARMLAKSISATTHSRCPGVTRHQLLLHPSISYTSHNSSACIELIGDGIDDGVERSVLSFMQEHFNPGSDPGVAISAAENIDKTIIEFGRSAQNEVLRKSDALDLAAESGVFLKELGGTGDGVIGALAAIGLRASGNDGRFVDLDGVRELDGTLSVKTILSGSSIEQVIDIRSGTPAPDSAQVDTQGWVRPNLVNNRVVLFVLPLREGAFRTIREKGRKHQHEV